jgi:hypothetical protein
MVGKITMSFRSEGKWVAKKGGREVGREEGRK